MFSFIACNTFSIAFTVDSSDLGLKGMEKISNFSLPQHWNLHTVVAKYL